MKKYVKLFMNLLVLHVMPSTMFKMIPLNVKPSKKKSVRTSLKVTQPNKNVPNGPYKSVRPAPETLRSTVQKLNVRKSHEKFADPAPPKFLEPRNALTEKKPLFKKFQMKLVTWSLKGFANMLPSWYLFLNHKKNVSIFQKKSAPDLEPTQERFKSLLLRNGATYQLLNLVWLKNVNLRKHFLVTI